MLWRRLSLPRLTLAQSQQVLFCRVMKAGWQDEGALKRLMAAGEDHLVCTATLLRNASSSVAA